MNKGYVIQIKLNNRIFPSHNVLAILPSTFIILTSLIVQSFPCLTCSQFDRRALTMYEKMLAFTKNKPTNQKNNKNLCWSFKNMQSQNHKPTMFMSVMNMFENAIYFCTLDWLSRLRWCTEEYINMISKYYCSKMTSEWTEPSFHEDGQTVPKLPHMTGVSGLHSQQVTVVELAVPAKYSTGVLRPAQSTGQNDGLISSIYDPYIQQVSWGLHGQQAKMVDSSAPLMIHISNRCIEACIVNMSQWWIH